METLSEESVKINHSNWREVTAELVDEFCKTTSRHDKEASFVFENYKMLKDKGVFSAAIPEELGGGGMSHSEMCEFLFELSKSCSSTALALSMHQHLVAANIWKYKKGQGAEELLRKIAANQLILISTGAGDWLASNGTMEKVEGGYIVNAQKHFASQSVIGNILVTTSVYQDPEAGPQVLHFPVAMNAEGIAIQDNWYSMGMRGTGSNTVVLKNVFVPESAIAMRRVQNEFHPFYNVVISVAMPLIMGVYVGIAERAYEIALSQFKKEQEHYSFYLVGEMERELVTAKIIWNDMIRIANNFQFEALMENGTAMLTRKSILADACIKTVSKAMEIVGGRAYLQNSEIERLYRDVRAVIFHPLPEKAQQFLLGNYLLGNKIIMK
jgi:alkylation response protein AidB-like acyl-CoA dehydrogenase